MKFHVVTLSDKLGAVLAFAIYDTDEISEVQALVKEQGHIDNLDRDFLTNIMVALAGDCRPKIVNEEEFTKAVEQLRELANKAQKNALTIK